MLAVPRPVGGIVAGCMAGAEREGVGATLSGAGGVLGMSEAGIVACSVGEGFAGDSDGVTTGAGLGTAVSPAFPSA
jgi:hypothetical protein